MSGHKSNYNFAIHCYLQKRSTALFWFQSQLWMSLLSCKCPQRREKDLFVFILHIKLKYGCYPPLFAGMQVIFFCFVPADFHRDFVHVYDHNKSVPSIVNSCRIYRFFLYLKRYIGRAVYWKIVFSPCMRHKLFPAVSKNYCCLFSGMHQRWQLCCYNLS